MTTRRPTETGFLNRWSERKRAGEAEEAAQPSADEAQVLKDTQETPDTPEKSDEDLLEELGLPDPDSLQKGDDFSAFMKAAIPARLRNRALRRLWISDPLLANLDELIDYGDDFTDAATVIENLQTVYEVGKGMPRPLAEALERAEREAEAAAQTSDALPGLDSAAEPEGDEALAEDRETPEAVADDTPADQENIEGDETIAASGAEPRQATLEPEPKAQAQPATLVPDPVDLRPRRMAFRFD